MKTLHKADIVQTNEYPENRAITLSPAVNKHKKRKNMKNIMAALYRTIVGLTSLLLVVGALNLPAVAQDAKQDHSDHSMGQDMKMPHTAQEHRERAEQYQKKAAEYRKEAQVHKQMLADYSKTVVKNPKDTSESGYIKKMRLHCEKYGKSAEALAQEADEMAKFHSMRAKEMEGK